MALTSPGVEVSIIDESNYLPAGTGSVPYILIATAENKASGTGTGVAPGTLAENAGRLYLITSQRDLASVFGAPFFYNTTAGTPINGFELNEYGLLAAHSVLGISNRAYIQRADVDLGELTASLVRPIGAPNNGTNWLDTALTQWGIFQWNQTAGTFVVKTPIVITDDGLLSGGIPSETVGIIGDYAVVATNSNNPVYYKNAKNDWVLVGSDDWKSSWPTVQGTQTVSGAVLTQGNSIVINGTSISVPPTETLASLVSAINSASIPGVTAEVDSSGRFVLYANSEAESDGSTANGGLINIESISTSGLLSTLGVESGLYYAPSLQQSPNFTVPRWRVTDSQPRPTGSVWNKTTVPNQGAALVVKRYDSTLGTWLNQLSPIYQNDWSAIADLDSIGGGENIPAGTIYVQYNTAPESTVVGTNNTLTMKIYVRATSGPTVITGSDSNPIFTTGESFSIQASQPNSATLTTATTVTIGGTGSVSDFIAAVSSAGIPNVSAAVLSTGQIVFTHARGGVIVLKDVSGTPIADAGINTSVEGVKEGEDSSLVLSNWEPLNYTASDIAPGQNPVSGRKWYYSAADQVDIMIHNGTNWVGYQNTSNDVRGFNLTQTNPTGPMVSPTEPLQQTDGTPLVYGDLWIDTSDLEVYPLVKRWENVSGVDQWVTLDNADQTTENGILFADARWAGNGTTDPVADSFATITSLLTSNYLDIDAPNPAFYPTGTLLWNTRRSGFNVKEFRPNYFTPTAFSIESYSSVDTYSIGDKVLYNGVIYVAIQAGTGNIPTNATYWARLQTNAWVNASGNRSDGSPNMGRLAVRSIIVQAMKQAIDTQDALREEQNTFNLIACPGYPELISNMVALNNERSNTAFVVGDTPLRLAPTENNLTDWATNGNGVGVFANDGLSVSDRYAGVFYPSCQTNDLSGNTVVQPASHMILRTIVRSDEVSYPWLAPSGVRRGLVDNANRLGYVNSQTGEFVSMATSQGLRDVLYENRINPVTFIPGSGIVNYGNKTVAPSPSALDRINVSRLVAYIRSRLGEIAKNFIFEPNDKITRDELFNAINGLMVDLVAKRGIYDYLVVCDESNNTPSRIDRNELYVDIAIEPVKAVEFVYIPVRIKNTGEIAGGNIPPSLGV